MTIAQGVKKELRYKVESAWATAPGATGAQLLRRVESTLDLTKETYESQEIRPSMMVSDFRHGIQRVGGNIRGEYSPKTYADFIAAILRRDFAAVSALTGLSITVAGSGPTYTLTRGSGSYLTDGVKVGDVVRLTAGSFAAPNLNKNLLVVTLTATVATVIVVNASTLTAEGPIASATLAVTGKKTFVPTTGHSDKSFAIEHWFSDINQSELYLGCKPSAMDIGLPPTGLATIDTTFMGKGRTRNTSAYYSSPTAVTATGIEAAVNGVLRIGGSSIVVCTGLSLRIEGGHSSAPVVGSNQVPAIFQGRVRGSGQFTVYFEDATLRDAFEDETEISLIGVLTTSNIAAADFSTIVIPRIKVGGASKSDGEQGILQTFPYTALENTSGGAGTDSEASCIVVQDSQAA